MNRRLSTVALACFLLFSGTRVFGQLQEPTPPVNLIIDSGMAIDVDDVGAHAVLWAMANRGEVNVLALICSSANDYSCPTMRVIANYYNHPNVPIGAHMGSTPNTNGTNTSAYTQQITSKFGAPGDIRSNYPDAVTVYRQALAAAADNSVYILANGYYQPLQGLLQSQPDAISPLTGLQLVTQKVRRLVSDGGWFPSGSEGNFENDTDAASYVFVHWPGEIVSVGVNATINVLTGPSTSSDPTQDPVPAAYNLYASSQGISPQAVHAFGQVSLLYAVRGGIGTNFSIGGFNGQTTIDATTDQFRGENFWASTPQVGQSYLNLAVTPDQMAAIINPLLQSSSTMPILRSISPTSVAAGGSGQITLTGTNFFSDSQAQFNGSNRPTTFVSATQLTVQLSSSDLAQAGQGALTVANTEGLGWTSNAVNLTITAASGPTLTSISPTSATAGSGPITLTATGANFASSSTIQVNGASRSTTFVSGTQLTTTLTAADLAVAGSLSITVNTLGGGTSSAVTFTVNNPVPAVSGISPTTATAGGSDFTLTVNGSNFVSGSVVQVNGSARTTTFVSSTQLTATVVAADIASTGTLSITVNNAGPGGGTSSAATLTVTNPANPVPVMSSISPGSVTAGSGGFTLTVNGSSFVSGSVVQVNGSARATTFVSSTQLTAAIAASDVASSATLSITVNNPAPGGGTSSAASLTVTNPAPVMSSISPSSVTAGSGGFTLTVNGSSFVSGAVVQVNGSARATTFVSSTQLTASVGAGDVASPGTLSITVNNPAPGGGTSSAATLTVTNPAPVMSSISPSSVTAGSGGFTLTVNGSNFISGSVVRVNGSNRTTTFVNSTQLTAAIPASDLAVGALLSVTVFTPAPGGGTSSAATLTVTNPAPSVSSISPSTALVLGNSFTLTVNGSGFINGSVVEYDGSPRVTTFVSPTQVTAQITNHDLAALGQHSITVVNSAPGGGTSNSATLTVVSLL
jgi:hypothetical protein